MEKKIFVASLKNNLIFALCCTVIFLVYQLYGGISWLTILMLFLTFGQVAITTFTISGVLYFLSKDAVK